MKAINILDRLRTKPVFRVQDIERIASCDNSYAKQVLNRLKSRGLTRQVRRNVYTMQDDISLIASNITYPSYISFWYASYSNGYTEQIVNTVHVASTRRTKPIKFEGYTIKFVPMRHFFGYKKTHTNNGDAFFVEDEKLLIDAFLKPGECGNFDEIEKIFENAGITKEKLIDYLKRINNQTLIKRVGYLIEKTRGIDLSRNFKLDRNYVLLSPFSKHWKTINSKWRVKV